jgi:hypothetical protein
MELNHFLVDFILYNLFLGIYFLKNVSFLGIQTGSDRNYMRLFVMAPGLSFSWSWSCLERMFG